MNAPRPLRVVVGEQVRRLREESGKRQDDLAAVARTLGLSWTRSKIAALERGEKAISGEELLLLPELLTWALDRRDNHPVTFDDLFDGDGDVALTKTATVRARDIPSVLRNEPTPLYVGVSLDVGSMVRNVNQVNARLKALGLGRVAIKRVVDVERTSGEAEAKAAHRAGEPEPVLAAISAHLWGRSLSAERDERLTTSLPQGASKETAQAKRGRITRELDTEIRRFITARESGR